jgi:hypothetical protein
MLISLLLVGYSTPSTRANPDCEETSDVGGMNYESNARDNGARVSRAYPTSDPDVQVVTITYQDGSYDNIYYYGEMAYICHNGG